MVTLFIQLASSPGCYRQYWQEMRAINYIYKLDSRLKRGLLKANTTDKSVTLS